MPVPLPILDSGAPAVALAPLAELRLLRACLAELRLLPGQLLSDELLQVPGDLLRGGGHHLRQDDLLCDRQELAYQRRDDLLDRELLLPRELGLHVGLLREAAVLLRLAEVLLDAERGREALLLHGYALDGRTLGGDWGGHKRPPKLDIDYCPVTPDLLSDKIGH